MILLLHKAACVVEGLRGSRHFGLLTHRLLVQLLLLLLLLLLIGVVLQLLDSDEICRVYNVMHTSPIIVLIILALEPIFVLRFATFLPPMTPMMMKVIDCLELLIELSIFSDFPINHGCSSSIHRVLLLLEMRCGLLLLLV